MNPKIKSQEEWLVMRSFRESFTDFPKGKLTKSESPDFVLKINTHKSIGIELSRIYKDHVSGTSESTLKSIVQRARELYFEHFKTPIFAWIYFNEKFNNPVNPELYATKIAIAVIDAVSEQKTKSSAKIHIESDLLPDGINRILIHAHQSITTSFWDCRTELTISDLFEPAVTKLVGRKDEKLSLYQKQIHDFYWLIIYADYIQKPTSTNFEKVIEQLQLKTAFHKVFLYNLFEEKYFLLSGK